MSKSYCLKDKIIYLKVENAYAVWFKASRNFLMIEEPAFYILKLLLNHISQEEIIQKFSKRYKNPVSEVRPFILEINQHLQQYLNPSEKELDHAKGYNEYYFQNDSYYSKKSYSINEVLINISFCDIELEEVIHPLISHHEINRQDRYDHTFEIYRNSDKLILRINGDIVEALDFKETGYLKAAVLLRLLEILYDIENDDWMMTVHAAAVTNGKTAIVFPAMAGSGKSTLAALLHANRFEMLSDDFLAMDLPNKLFYQLPVAATIKQGSFEVLQPHYPELNNIELERAYTGKHVRYLPIVSSKKVNKGLVAKYFAFVKYIKDGDFEFNEVTKKIALQELLQETWINPTPFMVKEFFEWFDKTKFYELKYTNISDVVEVIDELFEK